MKKYIILESSSHLGLEKLVNECLNKGWEISGSAFVSTAYNGQCFFQPMIKEVQESLHTAREYVILEAYSTLGLAQKMESYVDKGWEYNSGIQFYEGLYLVQMVRKVKC